MPDRVIEVETQGPEPAGAGSVPRPDDLSVLLGDGGAVEESLHIVVEVAVGLLPGVSGASVTLSLDSPARRFETAYASSDAFRKLDEVQYLAGSGPCVQAVRGASEVRAQLPATQWSSFSRAAGEASVSAVWSLPLEVKERITGALNLYSTDGSPWSEPAVGAARLLAKQAAAFLAGAVALAHSEHANTTLRRALETRTVIGQAQGVLMARQSIDADEAFDILRRASQRTNRKLREVAAEIVEGITHGGHRP